MGGGGTGTNTKYGATVDTFLGDVDSTGKLLKPTAQTDLVFDGVTDLDDNALEYRFYKNPVINSVSFPQLVQISGSYSMANCFRETKITNVSFPVLQSITGANSFAYAFENNDSIQSIEFPSLINISGDGDSVFAFAFYGCDNLTSVSFPVLEEITGPSALNGCFNSCANLINVQFPKLKKIGSDTATSGHGNQFKSAFSGTPKLKSLEFPELTAIYCSGITSTYGTFYLCDRIQKLYFPKLTVIDKSPVYISVATSEAQKYIFSGCSNLTEIHFGAANQAAIEASPGYSTLWGRGANNATVYFDL